MNNPHFLKLSFTEDNLQTKKFHRERADDGTIYFIVDDDLAMKIDLLLIEHEASLDVEQEFN